jgi:hypothetical protein
METKWVFSIGSLALLSVVLLPTITPAQAAPPQARFAPHARVTRRGYVLVPSETSKRDKPACAHIAKNCPPAAREQLPNGGAEKVASRTLAAKMRSFLLAQTGGQDAVLTSRLIRGQEISTDYMRDRLP